MLCILYIFFLINFIYANFSFYVCVYVHMYIYVYNFTFLFIILADNVVLLEMGLRAVMDVLYFQCIKSQ